jgi:hypothetical protein
MKFFFGLCIFIFSSCTQAHEKQPAAKALPERVTSNGTPRTALASSFESPDISPADIVYFPVDYPLLKMSKKADPLPVARIIYSRPHKGGRKLFGALIPYGEAWRLGANEGTEIELFQPVKIQNKTVGPGRYTLYCIPAETQWTIVFNTNIYSWGLKQDSTKDVHRFTIPIQKTEGSYEYFTMAFEKAKYGVSLTMSWDDITARLPITL